MISRTKLYQQRKYVYLAISSLLFYVLFARLGHLVYSIISLKVNGFIVENITFDSEVNDSCQVSVISTLTCPINFELSDIRATVQFDAGDSPVQIAEAGCSNIKIMKFDNLQFNATVRLRSMDLSRFSDLFPTSKLTVKLQMILQVRFLLIPLAVAVKSTVFSFDPNEEKTEKCQTADLLDENPPSGNARKVPITGELHEDINKILGRDVLRSLSLERTRIGAEEFFELKVEAFPPITRKHAKRFSVNLKNYIIAFKKPAEGMLIVKELVVNNSTYAMTLLTPTASGQSCLSELLVDFWAKGNCELEISAIKVLKGNGHVVKYQAMNNKGRLVMRIPLPRNPKRKYSPVHASLRNFRVEQNSLSCDFTHRKDKALVVLRRVVYSLFRDEKLCCSLLINGTETCKLSFGMNQLPEVLSLDGQEDAILKCTADFDQNSKISLKSSKIVEEISIKFEDNPVFVNGAEICFNLGHSSTLVVNGNRILFREGARSSGTVTEVVAGSGCSILLEHELVVPTDASVLCIKSELRSGNQFKDECDYLKVDLEDLDLRLFARRLDIRLKILRYIFGVLFTPGTAGNDLIFGQGTFISRLWERCSESTDYGTDLLSHLMGSDMLLCLNDTVRIPVQVIWEKSAGPKMFRDISLKYVPTHDISVHKFEISSASRNTCDMLASSLDPSTYGPMVVENRFKCSEVVLQNLDILKISATEINFSVVRLEDCVCFYFPCPAFVVLEFSPKRDEMEDSSSRCPSEFVKFALSMISVGSSLGKYKRDETNSARCIVDKSVRTEIVLEDTDQGLEFDLCVCFPVECTVLSKGLKLSLFREGKLTILNGCTGEEVLELSLSFSFTGQFLRSCLKLRGLVLPDLDRLTFVFSVDGRDIGRLPTDVLSTGMFIAAAEKGVSDFLGLFSRLSDVGDKNAGEPGSPNSQNLLHVEPRGQVCQNASVLDLDFGICSETINELISRKIAGTIACLPLKNIPKYLVLNIDVRKLPNFHRMLFISKNRSEGTSVSLSNLSLKGRDLKFELEYTKREQQSMTPEETRLHNRPILEKMYGPGGSCEIEYYEKYYGSGILRDDIFDKFFDFHMQLEVKNPRRIEANNSSTHEPSDFLSGFGHSSVLCMLNYLRDREYSAPVFGKLCPRDRVADLPRHSDKDSQSHCVKARHHIDGFGMFAARFFCRVNVIGSPFSIILDLQDRFAVHIRAFGLLSDPYFDCQSLNVAVPYNIAYGNILNFGFGVDTYKFDLYTICGERTCCLRFCINLSGLFSGVVIRNILILIPKVISNNRICTLLKMHKSLFKNYTYFNTLHKMLGYVIFEHNIGEDEFVKLDRRRMNEEYALIARR